MKTVSNHGLFGNWWRVAAGAVCVVAGMGIVSVNAGLLIEAVRKNQTDLALWTIGQGEQLHDKDDSGRTALHWAVLGRNHDIIAALAEKSPDLLVMADEDGNTPLHYAVKSGFESLVNSLLGPAIEMEMPEKFQNFINAKNNKGETAADIAVFPKIVELLKKGARIIELDREKAKLFLTAAAHGDLPAVKEYVRLGGKVDQRDEGGGIPIHAAVVFGHPEVVKVLAEMNPGSLTMKDKDGHTPLHYAVKFVGMRGQAGFEIVKALTVNGPEAVAVKDQDGNTPLHIAAESERTFLIKYIFTEALERLGHEKFLEIINSKNNEGITVQESCPGGLNRVKIDFYIECAKSETKSFKSLISAATKGDHVEVKRLLDEENAEAYVRDDYDLTPVHHAAKYGHIKTIGYLVDSDPASLKVGDADEDIPLHYAARGGYLKVVELMLEKQPVRTPWTNKEGNTPLHEAANSGHLDVVRLLSNAKPWMSGQLNHERHSPAQLARKAGHVAIAEHLEELVRASEVVPVYNEPDDKPSIIPKVVAGLGLVTVFTFVYWQAKKRGLLPWHKRWLTDDEVEEIVEKLASLRDDNEAFEIAKKCLLRGVRKEQVEKILNRVDEENEDERTGATVSVLI